MLGRHATASVEDPLAPSCATAVEEIRLLHLEAERTRAAALAADDDRISADLRQLADHYDREARDLNLMVLVRGG